MPLIRVETARPSGVHSMVVSCSDGCMWMANLPVGSMSRSAWMGSWLNAIRGCVHGEGPGSGRTGVVKRTKPELNTVMAVGPEGVSLMVSCSCSAPNWSRRPRRGCDRTIHGSSRA
jgi:hypothetical protein